jgi:P4 family phage/plasmid primase-like protien
MRGDGALTVFPGSVHESGQAIEWSSDNTTVDVYDLTREALDNYVHLVASASLIAKYWPRGSRHDATLALTGWLIRNKLGADEVISFVHAITSAAGDEEQRDRLAAVQTTINRFEEGDTVSGYPTLVEYIDERILRSVSRWMGLNSRTVDEMTAVNATDEGNADRFIQQHQNDVRYCEEEKSWYVWDGRIWKKDSVRLRVDRLAADTAKAIYEEAANAATQAERAELAAWATQSNNRTRLDAMLVRAASRPEIRISVTEFNANPDLITLPNGTYDLERDVLLPFDREHLITKMAKAKHNDNAPQPYLVRMMQQSIENQDTLVELQKAFGLSCSGRTDKVVFFCFGPTDTGKTTLLTQGLQVMLGDYAKQVSLEAIAGGKDRGKEIWMADIHGVRYALASEPPRSFMLDAAAIKSMTGDSTQKARALYEMPYDSRPVATIFIDTNYRPDVPDADDAIWNRIQLVHFKNKVKRVPGEPGYIPRFKEKIAEEIEMAGLLNWCIEGYRLWRDEGFKPSAEMQTGKQEYRAEQDNVQIFLDSMCRYDENTCVPAEVLWKAYTQWETSQGTDKLLRQSKQSFRDVLRDTKNIRLDTVAYGAKKRLIQCWIGVELAADHTVNMPYGDGNEQTFKPYSG